MESGSGNVLTSALDKLLPLKRLGASWLSFLEVVFNPLSVILVGCTLGLIYFDTIARSTLEASPAMAVIITAAMSLCAGLAGAFLEKRWNRISESGVLITRGKSAIRGLTLLLQNLNGLERRAVIYLGRAREGGADASVTSSYEEIIDRCNALEEEAANSIEEWQDIIPEANLKTQIGLITTLKTDTVQYSTRVQELEKQLSESQSRSQGERETLEKQLQEVRGKLNATSERLRQAESRLASSPLSGLSGFQPTDVRSFVVPAGMTLPVLGIKSDWNCPKCGVGQVGLEARKCGRCGMNISPPKAGSTSGRDEPK